MGRSARRRFGPRQSHALGLAPGELVAPPDATETRVTVHRYNRLRHEVFEDVALEALDGLRAPNTVLWVDILGLKNLVLLKQLGTFFSLHPLALEDAVEQGQRPKAVDHGEQTVVVLRDFADGGIEQYAIVIGTGVVLTVRANTTDPWASVRTRLHEGTGRLRGAGSDYLAYSLIDAVVDRYYPLIERFGQELDQLETRVYDGEDVITEIAGVQKALSQLRRNLWPTRQALGDLAREGRGHALSVQTQPYLRDAYDHAARLVELTESLREGAATLMDTHMGLASHRLGESMKVLTTIATIFMPLSFLAGLYGMNFDRTSPFNMPELGWRYGYVALLAVMGVLTAALVIVFRRKRWL